ncbi:YfcZ/YiiS family protein [Cedecea neteri]|uniref:YfcZ/YiiS family protein n=1 Tax=Cedecea neteri TaxID=158822 RepID=UPI00289BCD0D|nr:YfcZ/YiiS family protein [Cedecea neteri]
MSKNTANETPVCCCTDVGTIIDNTDCIASYSRVFTSKTEADEVLAALTAKAREVESEPCQITPRYTEVADGVQLDIDFQFSCQAETMIFQLGLR